MLQRLGNVVSILQTSFRIARYVRRQKIDILYANSIQAQVYCIFIKIFSGKKSVWHVRDRNPGRLLSFCCALASTRIICISQFIYRQTPGDAQKKKLIYNGLDTDAWAPAHQPRAAPETAAGNAVLLVGQVGQLIPWKRHIDLVMAAQQVTEKYKNVRFLVIGEDITHENTAYVAELKKKITEKGLDAWFSFSGFRHDIKECMDQLDILVHCAEDEPLGRVILEGMALEKPVLAWRSGGCAEIITDGVDGMLATPTNTNELSERLLRLLAEPLLRTTLGKNARKTIEERFSLAASILQWESVIDSL